MDNELKTLAMQVLETLHFQGKYFEARKANLPEARGYLQACKKKEGELRKACEEIVNGKQQDLFT